eukprot:CAMPEP_0177609000 /NCGR_PEP_ID=MMETSP0419_2-20121207/18807_1 /TAXON_ID=582737 /ORGANISM="Tetraselmis sp., Strain GSL018" /LENGTH=788 /DNA_ID=CAMNT_0019103799 /DNA_START=346 /DNA_END=2711 /DNA_ORIENTATION=-
MSSLPLPSAIVPGEAEEAALAEYAAVCRAAKTQLRAVWADLELGEGAVKAELERIVARAHEVWSEAVNQAKQRQNDLGLQIDEAWRESRSIQEELGQAPNAADGISSHPLDLVDDTPAGSMLTTNARYQRAARELEFWRGRKAERVEAMKGLRAEILRMHELLGKTDDTRSTGNLGISDDDLQSMKAEIESLRVEQLQRRRELAQAMMRLDAACDEVGEDCRRYAAAVHPSLEEFRHSASLNGQEPSSTPSSLDDVNLTDSTFRSLERKIEAVYAIKAEREAKVAELACKLAVLWDNLQMPEGDVDREIIVKLLGSSERLHPSTLDQCQEELERLEVKKARKTCHTIRVKHEELLKLAADAHMEDPGMGPLVGSLHKGPQGDGPMVYVRKVEEAHARVLQCIEATKAAAVKRGGVLAKISEIQGAVSEVEWLREYEQDSNRFKGRDSTRNLQRSIKAEKVRAQLPGLLQGTIQALNDWEDVEGEEFMYDGVSYKAHLVALKEEAEHALQSKGLHGKVSRSASAGRPAAEALCCAKHSLVLWRLRASAHVRSRDEAAAGAPTPSVEGGLCCGAAEKPLKLQGRADAKQTQAGGTKRLQGFCWQQRPRVGRAGTAKAGGGACVVPDTSEGGERWQIIEWESDRQPQMCCFANSPSGGPRGLQLASRAGIARVLHPDPQKPAPGPRPRVRELPALDEDWEAAAGKNTERGLCQEVLAETAEHVQVCLFLRQCLWSGAAASRIWQRALLESLPEENTETREAAVSLFGAPDRSFLVRCVQSREAAVSLFGEA